MSLTPSMQTALTIIRHNEVTYTFRPLTRSTRRPLPVTSRDLTPVYSHGLNARTVEALFSRGLVTLSPHGVSHGRVVDTSGDDVSRETEENRAADA